MQELSGFISCATVKVTEKQIELVNESSSASFSQILYEVNSAFRQTLNPILGRKMDYDKSVYGVPTRNEGFFPPSLISSAISGIVSTVTTAAAWTTTSYPTITVDEVRTVVDTIAWYQETMKKLNTLWQKSLNEQFRQWNSLSYLQQILRCCCHKEDDVSLLDTYKTEIMKYKRDLEWLMERSEEKQHYEGYREQLLRLTALLPAAIIATVIVQKYKLH